MQILLEPDPPPIVRTLATTLRRAAADQRLASVLSRMNGVAVVKSSTDPQAATLRFDAGTARVERGIAPDADVIIETDLATMNQPKPPRPKVVGATRHPRFALALAKVLDPPKGSWVDAARRFWEFSSEHPGMPHALEIVETAGGERVLLGGGEPRVELHGDSHWLTVVLSGNAILGEEILAGRIQFVGSLPHLAILTGRSIEWMLDGGAE